MSPIPPRLLDFVEMPPAEDVLLPVLRAKLPEIRVQAEIEEHQEFPLVLPRTIPQIGRWSGDTRFFDVSDVSVQVFTFGENADQDAARLSEVVRVMLAQAAAEQVTVDRGYLHTVDMTSKPRRANDFANATGSVQYASLPEGVVRFETVYQIVVRLQRQ